MLNPSTLSSKSKHENNQQTSRNDAGFDPHIETPGHHRTKKAGPGMALMWIPDASIMVMTSASGSTPLSQLLSKAVVPATEDLVLCAPHELCEPMMAIKKQIQPEASTVAQQVKLPHAMLASHI